MEMRVLETQHRHVPLNGRRLRVSVVGLGHIGSAAAAELTQLGHRVVGVDKDPFRLDRFDWGETPVLGGGHAGALRSARCNGLIATNIDLAAAVRETDVSYVCLNPRNDFHAFEDALRAMSTAICHKHSFHVFVFRAPLPEGAVQATIIPGLEALSRKKAGRDFGVCLYPDLRTAGASYARNATKLGASDLRTVGVMRRFHSGARPAPDVTTMEEAEIKGVSDRLRLSSFDASKDFGSSRSQVLHAEIVETVMQVVRDKAAKRVGFLGLAENGETCAVGGGLIRDIMAQLRSDGVQLYGHALERALDCQHRVGVPHRPDEKKVQNMVQDQPDLFYQDVERVVSHADVVLICAPSVAYFAAVDWIGRPSIDLSGLGVKHLSAQ